MFTTGSITAVLAAICISGVVAAPQYPSAPSYNNRPSTTLATHTSTSTPSKTVSLTGVTHTVVAGRSSLVFEPNNIVAQIGDIVEWHYFPKNHSVAQSSFGKPCVPIDDNAVFSGFNFKVDQGQSDKVFQLVVKDQTPFWFYCSQTVGNHCQNGMSGVINQNFDGPNTLAKYQEMAKGTGVSISPPIVQGGNVIANPNPLAGA
jgi:plastocyanin